MSTIYAVYKDFLEPEEGAAKKKTTQQHSHFGMANLFDLLLKSLPSGYLKYGLNIAAKENH